LLIIKVGSEHEPFLLVILGLHRRLVNNTLTLISSNKRSTENIFIFILAGVLFLEYVDINVEVFTKTETSETTIHIVSIVCKFMFSLPNL